VSASGFQITNSFNDVYIGAGSVLQHVVANGGNTQPPLFRAAMTSSTFFPSQYWYNDTIPEVCMPVVSLQAKHIVLTQYIYRNCTAT
jgi:hypothetical protein